MINNFKETVQAMSAKEIIMSMVEGLINPVTKINMGTYGEVNKGICYGCAATNTICKIGKISSDEFLEVAPWGTMRWFANSNNEKDFLYDFEICIDKLRKGYIGWYNDWSRHLGIAEISIPDGFKLPRLGNNYTEEDLKKYVELANLQE